MKRPGYKKIFLGSLAFLSATQSAQAGLSDMINNTFTFREEQKDLIRPNYTLPPKHVLVPHYDQKQAQKWSNYYTRSDLEAQKHMDDSSMVMRPLARDFHSEPSEDERTSRENVSKSAHPYTGQNDRISSAKPSPLGYEAIERRDHLNRLQNLEGNVYVGEPGSAPHLNHNAGINVGRKITIGAPKKAWDDRSEGEFASTRPGDYDYKRIEINAPREKVAFSAARASGYAENVENRTYAEAQPGTSYHVINGDVETVGQANGLPTSYVVENGDTLSGISDKDQIYGDWKLWPIIYDANKNQIQDPDLIHPKQNLGIPRSYTNYQAESAKHRAVSKKSPYHFYDGQ